MGDLAKTYGAFVVALVAAGGYVAYRVSGRRAGYAVAGVVGAGALWFASTPGGKSWYVEQWRGTLMGDPCYKRMTKWTAADVPKLRERCPVQAESAASNIRKYPRDYEFLKPEVAQALLMSAR